MLYPEDLAEFADLKREQKFVMAELLARRRLEHCHPNGEPIYSIIDYAIAVSATAKEYGIAELDDFELPWVSQPSAPDECANFRARAIQISQRLMFRHGTKSKSVKLDNVTKKKIGKWLELMRAAVRDAADLASEKKDRLFALIDELQYEVDRERTPVHAAGELWVTICSYAGDGAKKALEPVTPYIERIGAALGMAIKTEDSQPKQLPPAPVPKRIEGPRKKSIVDDIPF